MRALVAESWHRSHQAGVDADLSEARTWMERREVLDYRAGHILAPVYPLIFDVLGRAAVQTDCVLAVSDGQTRLLWVAGRPGVKRQAESIRFVEGTDWAEDRIGTNALGTSIRLDDAVHINSREHFATSVKDWSCAAAPIHHPETDAVLGVVDVTGTGIIDTPQTLAMVKATARMAESELGRLLILRRALAPEPNPDAERPLLKLTGLGRPDLQVEWGERTGRLSRRHSDIVAVLAEQPDGVSGEQLSLAVYDEDIQPSTMRAQMTRLRGILGAGFLHSRPYRLEVAIQTDWGDVVAALRGRRLDEAVRLYKGPLLPASDAPGVVEQRNVLERELTQALLTSHSADLLASATRSRWASENLELWERQTQLLPRDSPLWAASLSQVHRLRTEYGIAAPGPRVPNRLHRL
ncbi:Acetoin dehydrogenase operon transcriptional activator AcoR [Nocardioides aquaticus]|uniref:Acetoin dehydrogenase operon transcriptional activator AcoR n=1 Tax=Nocardioides aquaticus TaxID=160826 RepID=A0ABX8EJK0_9ACTN|nr:transcriptional regulator [Nocardioides aquaticus]QVT79262.1 Acetoin dehydrogenase operon transcriptional activator AcoR [Nocardioides aquaticus]